MTEIDRLCDAFVGQFYPTWTYEEMKAQQPLVADGVRDSVKAILTALREPSEGLIDAIVTAPRGKTLGESAEYVWIAGIDHILQQPGEGE